VISNPTKNNLHIRLLLM